ncbi:MAG: hypothetical protein ACTSP4_10855 [Candidatus Hodarchaeales archaeon]
MTPDICAECATDGAKIYRCSKCGEPLCRHAIRSHVCSKKYSEFRIREKVGTALSLKSRGRSFYREKRNFP